MISAENRNIRSRVSFFTGYQPYLLSAGWTAAWLKKAATVNSSMASAGSPGTDMSDAVVSRRDALQITAPVPPAGSRSSTSPQQWTTKLHRSSTPSERRDVKSPSRTVVKEKDRPKKMIEDMPFSVREKRMREQEMEMHEKNRSYHLEPTEIHSHYQSIANGAMSEVEAMGNCMAEFWQDYEGTSTSMRVEELERYRNFMQEVAAHLAGRLQSLQNQYDEHIPMARAKMAYRYTQDAQFSDHAGE